VFLNVDPLRSNIDVAETSSKTITGTMKNVMIDQPTANTARMIDASGFSEFSSIRNRMLTVAEMSDQTTIGPRRSLIADMLSPSPGSRPWKATFAAYTSAAEK